MEDGVMMSSRLRWSRVHIGAASLPLRMICCGAAQLLGCGNPGRLGGLRCWDVELSRIVMNAIVMHKTLWEGRVPWYITCFDMSERILCALERTKSKQKPAHKLRLSTLLRNRLHLKLQIWADVEPQVPVPTKKWSKWMQVADRMQSAHIQTGHIGSNDEQCTLFKLQVAV